MASPASQNQACQNCKVIPSKSAVATSIVLFRRVGSGVWGIGVDVCGVTWGWGVSLIRVTCGGGKVTLAEAGGVLASVGGSDAQAAKHAIRQATKIAVRAERRR
jgi:hypothetical protein